MFNGQNLSSYFLPQSCLGKKFVIQMFILIIRISASTRAYHIGFPMDQKRTVLDNSSMTKRLRIWLSSSSLACSFAFIQYFSKMVLFCCENPSLDSFSIWSFQQPRILGVYRVIYWQTSGKILFDPSISRLTHRASRLTLECIGQPICSGVTVDWPVDAEVTQVTQVA